MDSKLTLSLDKLIIEKAKAYAKSNKMSLSKMIENYLATLTSEKKGKINITPLVASISGVIDLKSNTDPKKEYTDFLIEKYK
ncbi:MAG: hypothetical protein COB60_12715 [Flavobacteriaceae bacterium]|nr:MAG: hypothetical protein COB60_12715 [Flavobacteriaceae bacterium]